MQSKVQKKSKQVQKLENRKEQDDRMPTVRSQSYGGRRVP